MFCRHCGKEVEEDSYVCVHCGRLINNNGQKNVQTDAVTGDSKTGVGVLCGLFLGLIGLIIGLLIYPTGSEERRTFAKGWGIAFGIVAVAAIIFFIVYIIVVVSAINNIPQVPYYY